MKDEAAVKIQAAYRGYRERKTMSQEVCFTNGIKMEKFRKRSLKSSSLSNNILLILIRLQPSMKPEHFIHCIVHCIEREIRT